jgi:WD40 repeat protein
MRSLHDIQVGTPVAQAAVSPNGDLVAVIQATSGNVQLWALSGHRNPRLVKSIEWQEKPQKLLPRDPSNLPDWEGDQFINQTVDIAFSIDGRCLAAIGPKGSIDIYDLSNFTRLASCGMPGQFSCCKWLPTGQLVASGWKQRVASRVLEKSVIIAGDGEIIEQPVNVGGGAIALHPDGNLALVSSVGQGGAALGFLQIGPRFSDLGIRLLDSVPAEGIEFSPVGDAFACVGEDDGLWVEIIDLRDLRPRFRHFVGQPKEYRRRWLWSKSCAFSGNGSSAFFPTLYGHIVELDAHSGSEVSHWHAHDGVVMHMNVSTSLITCGQDGLVRIWELGPPATPIASTPSDVLVERFSSEGSVLRRINI